MKVIPHILLKAWDIIKIPWCKVNHFVTVVGLIEWKLLVDHYNNRFTLHRGFFLKEKDWYEPILFEECFNS